VDDVRVPEQEWNPRAALDSLVFDNQMEGGDAAAATARILREHSLLAAQSICHLAAYAQTERVRLDAARYIVDTVLASGLDADIRLQAEQTKIVGQALYAAVRALGLRYGFDPNSPEVRSLARETILTLATGEEEEGGS
jgi:hypothetical protein